jgi:predicted HTH transcriptional regulator
MSDPRPNIDELLASGAFEQFIGLVEDRTFEAKNSTPYELDKPSGMFELAKDASAFANSAGGHIIVGLREEPILGQRTGKISALDLIPQDAFPAAEIRGKILKRVHPRIKDLKVEWFPSANDPSKGVGSIRVPPQSPEAQLFLITNVVEAGEVQKEIIVGIARRVGSDNTPLTVQEIYGYIRRGFSPKTQQLDRIEEKLDAALKSHAAAAPQSLAPPQLAPSEEPSKAQAVLKERIRDIMGGEP